MLSSVFIPAEGREPVGCTVLTHAGPWAREQLETMASRVAPDARVVFASLYGHCDQAGLATDFARRVDKPADPADGPRRSFEEARLRCRLLRKLEPSSALARWSAIRESWGRILDRERPFIVLSELIDSYIADALYHECQARGIPFLGLVTTFVNGYFRVTAYGEHVDARTPTGEEVEKVLASLLAEGYRPRFVASAGGRSRLTALQRWSKNIFRIGYYSILRLLPRYRMVNHVEGGLRTALEWFHFPPVLDSGSEDWMQASGRNGRRRIYVPLQHCPEATIDYWCRDIALVDYERRLLELLERWGDRFDFVLKEHPNVLGLRSSEFYCRAKRIPGVVIAPTSHPSTDLALACDAVLVWTGSVGFEAALRGVPVIMMTPAYYASGSRFFVASASTDADELERFVATVGSEPISPEEQRRMVAHLLSGLLPGSVAFGRAAQKDPCRTQHAAQVGDALAACCSEIAHSRGVPGR